MEDSKKILLKFILDADKSISRVQVIEITADLRFLNNNLIVQNDWMTKCNLAPDYMNIEHVSQ